MSKKPQKAKRFKYALETVLKYRKIVETQEHEKFIKDQKAYLEEKDKEEQLKMIQKNEYRELTDHMSAGKELDFQQIEMRRGHLDILKEKVISQTKVREEAEEKKETQRKELVKSVKNRKIMETDKDKKRVLWKKVMDKEEGKFLDELGTIGFERHKREARENQSESG